MSNRYAVEKPSVLLTFLAERLDGMSRNSIRQRLQSSCVLVNAVPTTQAKHALEAGDVVEVLAKSQGVRRDSSKLEVLYEDADLVAIHKPAGLLSVASANEGERHALALLRKQRSTSRQPCHLWPVHRLDRDTSGVLLFATSAAVKESVSADWSEAEKNYLAIVEGRPLPAEGTIDQPLRMDVKGFRALVGAHAEAKPARTHYQTIRTVKQRTLLEVQIETGRQHQIRAHLAWLQHPVIGDVRYGQRDRRLALHALRLSIPAPLGGGRLTFEAPPPPEFSALLR
jgi:23S rRNA pseudouridine1911/1915/1917 synthase